MEVRFALAALFIFPTYLAFWISYTSGYYDRVFIGMIDFPWNSGRCHKFFFPERKKNNKKNDRSHHTTTGLWLIHFIQLQHNRVIRYSIMILPHINNSVGSNETWNYTQLGLESIPCTLFKKGYELRLKHAIFRVFHYFNRSSTISLEQNLLVGVRPVCYR